MRDDETIYTLNELKTLLATKDPRTIFQDWGDEPLIPSTLLDTALELRKCRWNPVTKKFEPAWFNLSDMDDEPEQR